MEKLNKLLCFGCGAQIQTDNKAESGFIELNVLNKNPESFCKRCFSIKNYSKDTGFSENFNPQNTINKQNIKFSVVAIIVDIFNIAELGRIYKTNKKLIESNETWIIINKVDLLPKSVNLKKVRDKIVNNLKMKFKFSDIIMFSALKLINTDELLQKCNEAKKNVYLLGSINSGKSSIANSLLKAGGASEDEFILESHFPHTTLGSLEIPISKKHKLVDLPGLVSQEVKMLNDLNIKTLNVKGEQKTTTFQLDEGQSILLDGFARIDFTKGDKTSFTFYSKNIIKPHRTLLSKKEVKLDYKFTSSKPKKNVQLNFTQKGIKDIEIPGIGFIRFQSNNQVIEVQSIFDLSIRNTII